MRKMPLLCLLLCLTLGAAQAQKISNIRSTLEPTCGYYTITFDLEGDSNELYMLKLVPYLDGMEISEAKFADGSGLDSPVNPGKDLQVFWNLFLESAVAGNWQFKFTTDLVPLVFVEGGSFMMGSNDGESDEKPIHKVAVSSFLIGKHEITQKQWLIVMGSNPSEWKGDNLPVHQVNYYDALDYCNKRSLKEGLQPCYSISGNTAPANWSKGSIVCDWSATGYRLPTEAEWEFAARGGNKSKGYKYSGSNDLGSVAWYDDNSGKQTKAVGTKQPNELGIYDMSGNVMELCWDGYDRGYYAKSPSSDPRGPWGYFTVHRGGCMGLSFYYCRVANRVDICRDQSGGGSGFRVVRAMK